MSDITAPEPISASKLSGLPQGEKVFFEFQVQRPATEAPNTLRIRLAHLYSRGKPEGSVGSDLFPKSVQDEAFERQDGLCGICGADLDDEYWEAHHINADTSDDDVENCVLLCAQTPRHCHLLIHAWNTQNAPIEDYEFRYFDGDPDADDDEDDEDDD